MKTDHRRRGRRGRPPIPWTWEHVRAAAITLEVYWGFGSKLTCSPPGRLPCCLADNRRDVGGARQVARHAYDGLQAGTGRLTFAQMDAIMAAFLHAEDPHARPRFADSPYLFSEAADILESWLRDYDRRLPR